MLTIRVYTLHTILHLSICDSCRDQQRNLSDAYTLFLLIFNAYRVCIEAAGRNIKKEKKQTARNDLQLVGS